MALKGIPKGKIGPTSVDPASKGSNPANNSGGNPGKSMPQKPIPGPTSPGWPIALKKAVSRNGVSKKMPSRGL
jgi:hypothetical protein